MPSLLKFQQILITIEKPESFAIPNNLPRELPVLARRLFPFNFGSAIIHLNSSSCTTQITSKLHCHIPDQYSELQMAQLLLDKSRASV
ncbi:hypothetical protein CDAR_445941 [Caerostris darwini]|uniref:Uncharacterized protein n=1 Tax=Caerostris darwini TaxID=1538125 RepID=A0AAV4U0H0_9ARAC|nr:hypothetical protein CDAR_445941 [Caerostris darwini]